MFYFILTIAHNFGEITVPYLIRMLLAQDGLLKSIAAVQMRWAEKSFATLQMYYDIVCKDLDAVSYAIRPQPMWHAYVPARDGKDYDLALHSPFPHALSRDDCYVDCKEYTMGVLRILLHFCDFLFPLFGATGSGLDKVSTQIPAVYGVNQFLKTR